jgi:adenine-specific DNA-methyltransferase
MKKYKALGQVYTPDWLVKEILDFTGYNSANILDKFIFEPACGDGAFLREIVNRYITFGQELRYTVEQIKKGLETYIYGIEIDTTEWEKCIQNLNRIVEDRLSIKVDWKIFNLNTLYFYKNYNSFFDFVVGNPPYIRIHNLDPDTRELLKKEFQFSDGTIDIYTSFFELGINSLKNNGILGFITPNGYLHASSCKKFRQYLQQARIVRKIVDFKSNKVFENFSTYTAISILQKNNIEDNFQYYEYNDKKIVFVNNINFNNLTNKDWSFANPENEKFLQEIRLNENVTVKDFFDVQYALTTLRDKIFIGKVVQFNENLTYFNSSLIENNLLKRVVKASRFKGVIDESKKMIFPYEKVDNRWRIIPEEKLKTDYPNCYTYFKNNKAELENRDLSKNTLWYEYGRSQGIQTVHNEKIIMSNIIKDSVEFYKVPNDILVYSGLFITKNNLHSEWEMMEEVLKSEDFIKYLRLTGKDLSSGYKQISSKHVKEYKICEFIRGSLQDII